MEVKWKCIHCEGEFYPRYFTVGKIYTEIGGGNIICDQGFILSSPISYNSEDESELPKFKRVFGYHTPLGKLLAK